MNTWILTMQALLISAGALLLGMAIKASVPATVNEAPAIRDSEPAVRGDRHLISVQTPPPEELAALPVESEIKNVVEERKQAVVVYESGDRIVELKPVTVNGLRVDSNEIEDESVVDFDDDGEVEDASMEANSAVSPERIPPEFQLEYFPTAEEKPPVTPRINRRRPIRTAAEGAIPPKPEKNQTLESVWKMITEARHDSFATSDSNGNYSPPTSSSFQKEPSPTEEELNRRFEDFIRKINDEMRIQRQKSLDQHMKKKKATTTSSSGAQA
ncbi:uncharacterized protein LOC127254667 isoform X2 [Andrographis paniculata]|uniref:uncharacterized protein LOC127254667 isoform X2 n=1 Tax=Andrographis paniculata TaxID=175694 RepID=UPI0021E755B7|nr:uncharacterized protein LOC127254667 isoform X2 [Andrographis paniculata]